MKEFLVKEVDEWTLQLLDSDTEENSYRVAVPIGADALKVFNDESGFCFYKDGYTKIWQDFVEKPFWGGIGENISVKNRGEILWQRSEDFTKVTIDDLKHSVYKKDVSHLKIIDVYRVLELFGVESHAVGHAIKKLLLSGGRGAKDEAQDIQEAIDSLIRYQEMKNEDKKPLQDWINSGD